MSNIYTADRDREDSLGEYLVGASFNPSDNAGVDVIKQSTALLIDFLMDSKGIRARERDIAIERYEEAAMWAVKAITKPIRK